MKTENLNSDQADVMGCKKGAAVKALKFISDIKKHGIPDSAITTNDWNNCQNIYVYITIPYSSKKNGGKYKKYKNRFGKRTYLSGIKFWNTIK